jgi:two-component system, chemotaxis family, chemotaxis protein CheY
MTTKILVIDDSLMVRRQVGGTLAKLGYQIVEAVDGADALEKLEANRDARLIVCDVNMPRMNGLEFLEQLGVSGTKVPVVMLTTEGEPDLIQRAKALGAKGWILKPFKPEFLEACARKWAPLTA